MGKDNEEQRTGAAYRQPFFEDLNISLAIHGTSLATFG